MGEYRHGGASPGIVKPGLQRVGDAHMFMAFLRSYKPRAIERPPFFTVFLQNFYGIVMTRRATPAMLLLRETAGSQRAALHWTLLRALLGKPRLSPARTGAPPDVTALVRGRLDGIPQYDPRRRVAMGVRGAVGRPWRPWLGTRGGAGAAEHTSPVSLWHGRVLCQAPHDRAPQGGHRAPNGR